MLDKQDKNYLCKTFATKKQLTQQALDIGSEFEWVHEEFALIHEKFALMDKRFDKLEALIIEVLTEVRGINRKLDTTIKRVNKVEAHLGLVVA